jgi:hypothetical protein
MSRVVSPNLINNITAFGSLLIAGTILLSGCSSTAAVKQVEQIGTTKAGATVVVMPPDVKYFLYTAGGVPQPHADWTKAARENFRNALESFASERNIRVVWADGEDSLDDDEIAYQNLYAAVGRAILVHHFGNVSLPAKSGRFDWSLGPGIEKIGRKYNADYALFSFYRDYQASGGRVAFAVFAAVAGIGVPTSIETGFASLVDLKTGDVVWFNTVTAGSGEFRDPAGARTAIDRLFSEMPAAES